MDVSKSLNHLTSDSSSSSSSSKSIIIVDDEPDICETFKIALQENGYNVITFTNPIIALEHLLNNPNKYDLVISDYRMPYLNGCELGTKVKELNENIKVLLISSYDSIEDNNNKLNFEFHRKPVTLQKLLDIVDVSLNNNGKALLSARGYMKSDYQAVALVDDEEDIVNLFTELLRENGYNVYGFTDPFLLLDYIHYHNNQFRLVLIDYKMPQMTGCELANKIADINSRIEMVLVTAVNDIIKNNLNLELIRKPLRMHQLLQLVAKYIS